MWWLASLIIFGKRRSPCETSSVDTMDTELGPDFEPPTRQDLIDALLFMNNTAKAVRRQGYTGTAGQSYVRLHRGINELLDDLERPDSGRAATPNA